jgi:hypothetical protein
MDADCRGPVFLLTLRQVEVIKPAAKLRSDLVEHFGCNLQVELGVAQPSAGMAKMDCPSET